MWILVRSYIDRHLFNRKLQHNFRCFFSSFWYTYLRKLGNFKESSFTKLLSQLLIQHGIRAWRRVGKECLNCCFASVKLKLKCLFVFWEVLKNLYIYGWVAFYCGWRLDQLQNQYMIPIACLNISVSILYLRSPFHR